MSVFASAGQKTKDKFDPKIERVKGALEHLSLYVGLAIYIALGAKVSDRSNTVMLAVLLRIFILNLLTNSRCLFL